MLIPLWRQHSLRLLWWVVAFCFIASAQAQIPVYYFGSATNTFGSAPVLTSNEWATSSAGVGAMGSGTFTTAAAMDAAVQSLDQSSIVQPLTTTLANGTALDARHNTSAGYLFTQPASVGAVVLKATLRNLSGLTWDTLQINYDYS